MISGGMIDDSVLICDVNDEYLLDAFNFEVAMRLLPLESQAHVLKKRSDKLKRAALINRLLQTYGCSLASNTPPKDLLFTQGRFGKPKLVLDRNVQFSMSNGEQSCVMVVQSDGEVGIDIASTVDCKSWDENYVTSFKDIFTDTELSQLSLQSNDKDTLFTLFWSMKESYMKLTGTGLNTNVKQIELGEVPLLRNHEDAQTIHRCINNRSVTFTSKWINDHEVVTVSTYTDDSAKDYMWQPVKIGDIVRYHQQ